MIPGAPPKEWNSLGDLGDTPWRERGFAVKDCDGRCSLSD